MTVHAPNRQTEATKRARTRYAFFSIGRVVRSGIEAPPPTPDQVRGNLRSSPGQAPPRRKRGERSMRAGFPYLTAGEKCIAPPGIGPCPTSDNLHGDCQF